MPHNFDFLSEGEEFGADARGYRRFRAVFCEHHSSGISMCRVSASAVRLAGCRPSTMDCHPVQHEAIVDRGLWEKVQQHLRDHAARHRERPTEAFPSPLAGRLFDENSEPLYAQGATKGGRCYRY